MPLPVAIPALLTKLPWRYILPGLGAALALWAAYDWVYDRGHDSRDLEVAELVTALKLERDNVATLKAGIATQNAAIAKQGQQQEAVAKASTKAVQRGAERRGRVDAMAARVEAVEASGAVAVPDDARALWEQS